MGRLFVLLFWAAIVAAVVWPSPPEDVEPLPAWAVQLQEIVEASEAE